MEQIRFKGRSQKDLETQKREFKWIMHNIENATSEETEEKWRKKMEKWMDAHPYTKKHFDDMTLDWAEKYPKELIAEAKRRGMI